MDVCVVDKVPERHMPPSPELIQQARQRQLIALQEVRRLLLRQHPREIAPLAR